jgi:nucleoside-diphosphate-sugar epimerase
VFLRAESLAEYGFSERTHSETDPERPTDAYAAALAAGTRYLAMLQPRLPFPVMTARLALTYGPGQSEKFFIPAAARACIEGRPITLRRPKDSRDLVHVDDVVRAFDALSAAPRPGAVVNIGTGVATPMRAVAELLVRLSGASPSLIREDPSAPDRKPRLLRLSPEFAERCWGWRARLSLEAGLARTLASTRAEIA